ncbi:beta-carotene 15,15'-monooxygenase-like protein [Virus Rctr71]|nr:beta-carotene 15,15'-monooxygenase-like protein [Virus Rctr71]
MKYTYLIGFIGTIFGANWLIQNVGDCSGAGPCTIPIFPGLSAPSGVLAVGLGFTLRDLVQRNLGIKWSILAIVTGALLSSLLSPSLAVASGIAFLASEGMDMAIYTPLQKKNLYIAVIGSNMVGIVIDSILFLTLAFGSLDFLYGQIIGKAWMTILFIPIIQMLRNSYQNSLLEGIDTRQRT